MKLLRAFVATSIVVAFALTLTAAAVASPGLDPTYGQGGVTAITPLEPGGSGSPTVEEFASARGGAVYVLARDQSSNVRCSSGCLNYSLQRLGSTGATDPNFGNGGAIRLPVAEGGYRIAVDAQGRALAAGVIRGTIRLHRFDLAGNLETSFGTEGTVVVKCGCSQAAVMIAPARRGRILVVGTIGAFEVEPSKVRLSLTRLLPTGAPDPTFGIGGSVSYPASAASPSSTLAVTPRGAILLGSQNCCTSALQTVLRVSSKGLLDTHFDRTAAKSLRRLKELGGRFLSSLVPRSDGDLDLLGSSVRSGFDLRLLADGRPSTGFGKKGLLILPLEVSSAALGSDGAIFAASPDSIAFRILADGRLDPKFGGVDGVASGLRGSQVEVGVQRGGRAVVMNPGYLECRFSCEGTPGIARFLEGSDR